MPEIFSVRIPGYVSALYKGIGDSGILQAAGSESARGFDGGVSARGEFDVEGDIGFRSQRHGVERGDEEACDLGPLVRVVFLDRWSGFGVLVYQGGEWIG